MKKTSEKFQIINSNELYLELDSALAATVAVREGDVLYAISLVHKKCEDLQPNIGTDRRLMTLIATPFHHDSWAGLLRLSVTIDPQPGSLFKLVQALNLLQIEIRYVEDVTGTRLSDLDINPLDHSHESWATDSFLPSAMLVVEIPGRASSALREAHDDFDQFRIALREIVDTQETKTETLALLENILFEKCGRKVSIRWISPMAPLNALSHLFKEKSVPLKLEEIQVGKMPSGLRDQRGLLQTSILPWRRMLWPADTGVPNSDTMSRESVNESLLVMASSDSDEKLIAWYFYEYSKNLVIYFELVAPASGLEQLWWEYIYNCVQRASGTVLGSRSSARLRGRWVTLYCTVMFSLPSPLPESHTEKDAETNNNAIRGIVNCLRELQGDRSYSKQWTIFKASLSAAIAQPWRKASQINDKSQLERLIVWDPYSDSAAPRFPNLFAENPFSFTLPLELATYDKLYEGSQKPKTDSRHNPNPSTRIDIDKKRTRRRLAKAIIGKLAQNPGENIAIVGAHRTGKTTVLNLVYDLLREGDLSRDGAHLARIPKLIPIRINASTTPPYRFFFSVLEGIAALEKDPAKGIRKLLSQLKTLGSNLGNTFENIEIGLAAGVVSVGVKKKEDNLGEAENKVILGDARVRDILSQIKKDEDEVRSEFLKLSLEALRASLQELNKPGSTASETRIVVIMDEFSEVSDVEGSSDPGSAGWGNSKVLSVWRHACESREYSSIKWLVSTTRPVKEAVKYSPLTNIFFEWNVGPLEPDESRSMIDAFSVTAWQNEPQDGRHDSKLRPIITYLARNFLIKVTSSLPYLLQVSCYHIYDKATRSEFPVINKALCRKIIRTKVLPELADYLEHQWSQIPEEARRFIKESLPKPKDPGDQESPSHPVDDFLKNIDNWKVYLDRMPPGSLKALNRSGLRGDDQWCVAPLVAAWLLTFT